MNLDFRGASHARSGGVEGKNTRKDTHALKNIVAGHKTRNILSDVRASVVQPRMCATRRTQWNNSGMWIDVRDKMVDMAASFS